jgi:hypothetical protein
MEIGLVINLLRKNVKVLTRILQINIILRCLVLSSASYT